MATINKAKLFDNASKFISKNQLDRAIKELNKILKADPDDVRARLKIGDLYAKKGQTAEACEAYRIVAESYSNDGFFLKAVAVYKQILKLDPSLTEVHLKLGDLYHQLGLVSDAMQQYQIVANFYQGKGMNRESLEVLRRMVDLDPENIQSRKNVAELLAREGHVEEALEEFRQIASDLEANNRIEDLVQVLERIAHLEPDNLDAVKRISQLYLERGDPKRSLAKLQVLFRNNPQDLETLEMLSRAFLSLNQPHKAKSVYREMAKLYDQSGDTAQRDATLRRILDLDPNDAEAQALLHGPPPQVEPNPAPIPEMPAPDPLTGGGIPEQPPMPEPVTQAEPPSSNGSAAAAAPSGGGDDPATISKLLTEADVYLKYGLLDRALDHLRNIVGRNPDNFEAHAKLKEVYLQHKDTDNAVAEILILADLAQREGRADEAQALLEEGLQIAPGNPELLSRTGASAGAPPVSDAGVPSAVEVSIGEDVSIGLDDDLASGTEELPPSPQASGGIEISIDDDGFDDVGVGGGDIEVGDPFAPSVESDIPSVDDPVANDPFADADALIAEAAADAFDDPIESSVDVDEVSIDLTDDDDVLPPDDGAALQMDDGSGLNPSTDTSFETDMNEIGTDDGNVIDEFDVSIGDDIPDVLTGASVPGEDDIPDAFAQPEISVEDGLSPDDLAIESTNPPESVGLDTPPPVVMPESPPVETPAPVSNEPIQVVDEIPPEVAEDVDEAEFFLSQEIYDEAIRVFKKLCKKHPNNTALQAKLQHAQQLEAGGEVSAPPTAQSAAAKPQSEIATEIKPATVPKETPSLIDTDTDSLGAGFDLAAELADELDDFEEEPAFGGNEDISVDEVLEQFKKGVDKTIGQEDKQARFDLGLAYKDMGLFDEAINEFKIAMQDPARKVECLGMIGVVQREMEQHDAAIETFTEALEACTDDKQKPGLLFDMALTREAMGDKELALKLYRKVQQIDASFRGVKQKIEALGGGDGDDGPPGPNGAPNGSANGANGHDSDESGSRKSKISYV